MRGAWLLTAAALLGKLLGALYKIPLTRALGAHGMGMYQSVFPSYALLVTLTGGGITAAVSKLTAEEEGRFDCVSAVLLTLCVSLPATVIAVFCARPLAMAAGAPSAVWAFVLLVLSVPLSAASAVLRGYFQGADKMMISALGQLVEQSVKLVVGLTLAFLLAPYSLTAAVAGCAAGVTVSEGAATLYYAVRRKSTQNTVSVPKIAQRAASDAMGDAFFGIEALTEISSELVPLPASDFEQGKAKRKHRGLGSLGVRILKVSLPVTLGMLVLPLCQMIDSFVIVNLLTHTGTARETATSLYGLVTGPVNALANMPAVFTVGLCGTLLPKISQLVKKGERVSGTVRRVLAVSIIAGVVFCVGLVCTAPLAMRILYGRNLGAPLSTAVRLLRLAAVVIPLIAVMQTASAVLQGGGKAYIPVLSLAVAAIVKETLNFLLLPRLGIYGFVVATDVFYALACLLDGIALGIFIRRQAAEK